MPKHCGTLDERVGFRGPLVFRTGLPAYPFARWPHASLLEARAGNTGSPFLNQPENPASATRMSSARWIPLYPS